MKILILSDIHETWVHIGKMLRLAKGLDGVIFLGDLMDFHKFDPESITNLSRIKEASNWMMGVPGNGALPRVRESFDDLGINLHRRGRVIDNVGFFGVGGVQETIKTISEIRDFYKTADTSSISPSERALETLNAFGIFYETGQFNVEEWTEADLAALDVYSSPFENSDETIYEILLTGFNEIHEAPIKILLSHVPPYETGIISALEIGVSTGSRSIARFIEEHSLSLALSGHYHLHHEFAIGSTVCIVFPSVMDGYYGELSIGSNSLEIKTKIHKF